MQRERKPLVQILLFIGDFEGRVEDLLVDDHILTDTLNVSSAVPSQSIAWADSEPQRIQDLEGKILPIESLNLCHHPIWVLYY